MRLAQKLFRGRRIGQFFPIGIAASFVFGIAAAPTLLGSANIMLSLAAGVVLGLLGSAAIFGLLKVMDRR